MQKKLIIALLLLSYFALYTAHSIQAASPLASPTTSPSPSPLPASLPAQAGIDEVTQNLKKRLVESLEITTATSSARAYIGMVKDVIKNTVIIEDKDGKKDVKLTDDVTILRSPGNTSIDTDDIRIDDYIIAMGYLEDEDELLGSRLIVSATPIKPPPKTTDLGTVIKTSKTSLTLNIDSQERVVDFTNKTVFKSSVGSIELADLSVGDTLIYTATIDEDDALTATIFMRVATAALTE